MKKQTTKPSIEWLEDVNVFSVNRMQAHSDHRYYETMGQAFKDKEMPLRSSLNGNWKFHFAESPNSQPKEFYKENVDCTAWDDIQVPGHIQLQGFGSPQYVNTMYPWDGHNEIRPPEIPMDKNAVGSYVKYFTVPANMKGKDVFISFQGVESAFYLWLNGEFVGYSEDSFTPAEFDLTPYIIDGENKLAVAVYQRSTGSWLEDQDFWRFSGIFRDVYLYTVPKIHIYDMKIETELDATYTTANVEGVFYFSDLVSLNTRITVDLYDMNDEKVQTEESVINKKQGNFSMKVENPQLWSAESPYLYKLFISIFDETGQLVEVIPQKIGIRKFEMIDKVMHLNGKRIVFKGVNRHEFNDRTGRIVSKEDMLWDIKTLKQNNINAVRTSHYPNQSYWYELCDEYGVYVIDEMNLETHGSWMVMGVVEPSWNIPGNNMEWEGIVLDRAVSMYERDKNHPSILIWSVGNEAYGGEVLLNVSNYFRNVDPSRLVHYEGVFHAREYNDTSDMESRMYAKPAEIEAYLLDNPEKPYISCEYMHAMGNSLGGMYKYTDLEEKYPMYQGGFIWDYIDQSLVKKDRYGKEFHAYGGDFDERPTDYGFCTNGIVYANRELSPKMQEVKFLYQNFKLIPTKNVLTIKNESLFTNTAAFDCEYLLYLNGEEIYTEKLLASVAPGEEKQVELSWPEALFEEAGEYCVQVKLLTKEKSEWAEPGFEIAFGQYVFSVEEHQEKKLNQRRMRVVHGDVNIGVHGTDFSVMFSRAFGSLTSIKYSGKEMISTPPTPLFWRATTDNDRGFEQDYHAGLWFAASLARKCIAIKVDEQQEEITVSFTYQFSISDDMRVTVAYTVYPDGSVRIHSAYTGADNLPQLPIHALSFRIPADYQEVEWYAFGPEENYSDRAKGARLGKFHTNAKDSLAKYVVPQESGNRTGVRQVKVSNEIGQGLCIKAIKAPFECTVSPYTALELENAQHVYELPAVHYTVITVAGKQMGVGGDDSWGAPVHEEHLIDPQKKMEFEFLVKRI